MVASGVPELARLTDEQLRAAGSRHPRVYVEAAPGSGKTVVAAHMFGVARYDRKPDNRAIVALSFTRTATQELRDRIARSWGVSALKYPHRATTIDTLLSGIVLSLLQEGLLSWPGGHTSLEVIDNWAATGNTKYRTEEPFLALDGSKVALRVRKHRKPQNRVTVRAFREGINRGLCSHADIRQVLEQALQHPNIRAKVKARLAASIGTLIVDEVFDANVLDLELIRICCEGGVRVALVGDPWQALYEFRGARPALVRRMISGLDFKQLSLTHSFRFVTSAQRSMANALRGRTGYELEIAGPKGCDIILASQWKSLWAADNSILPTAFGSSGGSKAGAVQTLLLNALTQAHFGVTATFLNDAANTLSIPQGTSLQVLNPSMKEISQLLGEAEQGNRKALYSAWDIWISALKGLGEIHVPDRRSTTGLRLIQSRIKSKESLIPGTTIHQAKGREWGTVGVSMTETELRSLRSGLDPNSESDLKIYVALTRAKKRTVLVGGEARLF